MKKTTIKTVLLASLISTLVACGGSSGPETPEPPETPETPETPEIPVTSFNLTGKVIDGYVENATVFLDINNNNVLDDDEPRTTTTASGSYELLLTDEQKVMLQSAPVRALLGDNAIDIDTGESFHNHPALFSSLMIDSVEGDTGFVSISPFTSVVYAKIEASLSKLRSGEIDTARFALEWNAAKAELVLSMSEQLGVDALSAEALLGDFISEISESSKFSNTEIALIKQEAISKTNDYQQAYSLQKLLDESLSDNQRASVMITSYPFSDWNTQENMILREVNKTIYTTAENGDEIADIDIVKTRINDQGETLIDGAGEPIIYEIYQGKITRKADGTYTETGYWEKDLNGDNVRKVQGQQYKVGSYDENGQEVDVYFDEDSIWLDFDLALPSYSGINLPAAVEEGDLSAISQMQKQIHTTVFTESAKVDTFIFRVFYDQGTGIFDQQNYVEQRTTTTSMDGSYLQEILRDNNHDGVFDSRQLTTLTADGEKLIEIEDIPQDAS